MFTGKPQLHFGPLFKNKIKVKELKGKFPSIGDVRGTGLFIGIELIKFQEDKDENESKRDELTPNAQLASKIALKMRENGVLISTDGPFHNVLKIKPPLCLSKENVDTVIQILDKILMENL